MYRNHQRSGPAKYDDVFSRDLGQERIVILCYCNNPPHFVPDILRRTPLNEALRESSPFTSNSFPLSILSFKAFSFERPFLKMNDKLIYCCFTYFAQVNPSVDLHGATSILAANFLYEMMCVLPGVIYKDAPSSDIQF